MSNFVVVQSPEPMIWGAEDDMPNAAQNWGRAAAFLFVVPFCSPLSCWCLVGYGTQHWVNITGAIHSNSISTNNLLVLDNGGMELLWIVTMDHSPIPYHAPVSCWWFDWMHHSYTPCSSVLWDQVEWPLYPLLFLFFLRGINKPPRSILVVFKHSWDDDDDDDDDGDWRIIEDDWWCLTSSFQRGWNHETSFSGPDLLTLQALTFQNHCRLMITY